MTSRAWRSTVDVLPLSTQRFAPPSTDGSIVMRIAVNPTIERISDKNERRRILNEAWGRFNVVKTSPRWLRRFSRGGWVA